MSAPSPRLSQCRRQVTQALYLKLWSLILCTGLSFPTHIPPTYMFTILCSGMNDENLQCLQKNSEIDNQRTVINIAHIKQNPLIITDVLASTDLPQASNTGFDSQSFV